MTPTISIVIPTYNRADAIGLTLQHLVQQILPPDQFEVIVVDDGSSDDTNRIITSQSWPFSLTYLCQSNEGAAAARNRGVSQAQGDLLLFLDSDVIVDPYFIMHHLRSQQQYQNQPVLGRMRPWQSSFRPWYEKMIEPEDAGRDYGDQPKELPFFYAYSCNMSVDRTIFEQIGGFDESFPASGFEDTEFAYKMEIRGYRLFYQPQCLGYHNHPLTIEQRCKKEASYAASLALLISKHPHLWVVIPGIDELMPIWPPPRSMQRLWRRSRARFLGLRPVRSALYRSLVWLDKQQSLPRLASILFWRLLTGCRYVGFQEGLQRYGPVFPGR